MKTKIFTIRQAQYCGTNRLVCSVNHRSESEKARIFEHTTSRFENLPKFIFRGLQNLGV